MKFVAKKIYKELVKAQDILIVMHKEPDGDALGSSLAMFEFIKKNLQKNPVVYSSTALPENLKFLPYVEYVETNKDAVNFSKFSLILVLDSGDLDYANIKELVDKNQLIINIDHHQTNQFYGELNMVDDKAASTSEILYWFFKWNNLPISPNMATCLLTGLITDTGNFTNAATTTTALMVAGELVRFGAHLGNINDKTLKNKTIPSLKLWGLALSRLSKHREIDLAHTFLTQKDFAEHQVDEEMADGISNFLNNLEEAKIALVLKETKDGKIKGSLRTTHDDIDVAVIAQKLGGGGHRKAAGFTAEGNVDDILKKIADVYKEVNSEL